METPEVNRSWFANSETKPDGNSEIIGQMQVQPKTDIQDSKLWANQQHIQHTDWEMWLRFQSIELLSRN